MDLSSVAPSDSRNQQEERNFSRLFQVVLNKIINMEQIPERNIELAIEHAKRCFNNFKFLNITKWENLCGYLFRYAAHGAGLTRSRVLEAVRNSETLALGLENRDLTIVSLGGGPGNDIIGLCSALLECGIRNHNLNMTVVDFYEEWSICVTLVKKLITEENFGNASELLRFNDVKMPFLQVKLPGDPMKDENYFQLLQNADVILMVKLISIMDWNTVECFIKNLYENMKNEAFILYIDSPIEDGIKKHFDVLFESEEGHNYISSVINERFNFDDRVSSKSQIAVLRKKLSL